MAEKTASGEKQPKVTICDGRYEITGKELKDIVSTGYGTFEVGLIPEKIAEKLAQKSKWIKKV